MDERGRPQTLGCRPWGRVIVLLAAWAGVSGCLGPKAVRYTRLRYNEVVRDTNDEQLLMNIVRLRYADSPVFIDLPNITSQFEIAGRGSYPGGYGNQTNFGVGRRAVAPRHADPELPPARGAGDRQGAVDPAIGRPVHRGQRRGQPRAAPAVDHQRHQRRAERPPGHDPDSQGPRRQHGVPPGHPDTRVAPGSRRHRAGVRDERGDRRRLGPDLRGPRSRAATSSSAAKDGYVLPRRGERPGDPAQAGKGALPQDPPPVSSTPPRWRKSRGSST